jgi:hypothetical protein
MKMKANVFININEFLHAYVLTCSLIFHFSFSIEFSAPCTASYVQEKEEKEKEIAIEKEDLLPELRECQHSCSANCGSTLALILEGDMI